MSSKLRSKYRSKLEERVAADLGRDWEYEKMGISYLQPRTYLPDFLFSGNKKKKQKVIIEVKGFFRVGDVSKYKAIATSCKEQGYRFCMVLSHPDKPVRKGTKLTMAEWCNKNSIEWFDAGMLYLLKRSMK